VALHSYQPIDSSYFDRAPVRLDDRLAVAHPPDVVWKIFEDNHAWETFDRGIAKATWTSTPPLHPGSTRHVKLSWWIGGGIVNEVFFEWKPRDRFAFYMKDGSSNLVHAYGELWSVSDLGGGRSEIRFRTAFALNGTFVNALAKLFSPVLNIGYRRTLRAVKAYLDRQRPT
jgi:hypothetical protein